MVRVKHTSLASVSDILSALPDPEIPVVTLADLGILRRVDHDNTGHWTITITPTYSGCPAMKAIEHSIINKMNELNLRASVKLVLDPAWTTDWITNEGRRKLKHYGIAPPEPFRKISSVHPTAGGARLGVPVFVEQQVSCPRCDSPNTRQISAFGATACKEPWQCLECLEPFEHFKCH